MKRLYVIKVLAFICISNTGLAQPFQLNSMETSSNTSEQIGNSYFKSVLIEPISQIGGALESYQFHSTIYDSLSYVFFNQLTTNHIFYEVRAYGVYNYITANPLPEPRALTTVSAVHQRPLLGYGGAATLGYNININQNIAVLPFIRAEAITNTLIAYTDSSGNKIGSADYDFSIGAKLSKRISDVFALYGLGFIGYQRSLITGKGLFVIKGQATADVYYTGLEFGAPYKITKALSLTPYLQFIPALVSLNEAAIHSTYPFGQLSGLVTVYGFKVGYEF